MSFSLFDVRTIKSVTTGTSVYVCVLMRLPLSLCNNSMIYTWHHGDEIQDETGRETWHLTFTGMWNDATSSNYSVFNMILKTNVTTTK